MVKSWFSIKELVDLKIVSLPKVKHRLIERAKKDNWEKRPRMGQGGGFEYAFSSLPKSAQDEIIQKTVNSITSIAELKQSEIVQKQANIVDNLQAYQKETMDARAIILSELESLEEIVGINKAITKFKEMIVNNSLSPEIKKALIKANSKSGNQLKISRSTVFSWRKAIKESGTTLALAVKELPKAEWPVWGDLLLNYWQQPQKRSLQYCLDKVIETLGKEKSPSYSAAQRFIKKLPSIVREKGRMGTREIKKIKAFVKRDTSGLWPTAVYTADGHTFDAEVEHPLTGRPFRPEITTVVDIYTRKVVGWSIDLNERTNSVHEALSMALKTHGIPSIWYVDNGKGFNNKFFDDEVVGLLSRLRISKKNSIPYNSQARGIGERIHHTIWVRAAKELPTYMGADMDQQAKQAVFKKTRQDIAKTGGSKLLMRWPDFIKFCQGHVDWYNNRPHSGLPVMIDQATYEKRHYTPIEYWNKSVMDGFVADRLTPAEANTLHRYFEIRKVSRNEITWLNNTYSSPTLFMYEEQKVAICYEVHNAAKIWVYELDESSESKLGKQICVAELCNSVSYFPQSAFEHRDLKRLNGKVRRLQKHTDEAKEEYENRFIEAPIQRDIEEYIEVKSAETPQIKAKEEPLKMLDNTSRPIFTDDITMIYWLFNNPQQLTNNDRVYLDNFIQKPESLMLLEAEDISVGNVKTLIKKA